MNSSLGMTNGNDGGVISKNDTIRIIEVDFPETSQMTASQGGQCNKGEKRRSSTGCFKAYDPERFTQALSSMPSGT
jgi:hypothetical protein